MKLYEFLLEMKYLNLWVLEWKWFPLIKQELDARAQPRIGRENRKWERASRLVVGDWYEIPFLLPSGTGIPFPFSVHFRFSIFNWFFFQF